MISFIHHKSVLTCAKIKNLSRNKNDMTAKGRWHNTRCTQVRTSLDTYQTGRFVALPAVFGKASSLLQTLPQQLYICNACQWALCRSHQTAFEADVTTDADCIWLMFIGIKFLLRRWTFVFRNFDYSETSWRTSSVCSTKTGADSFWKASSVCSTA